MKKLRIGVIGLGKGQDHLINYKEHPQVEVVAIVDPDRERLEKAGVEFSVPNLYESAETMFAKERLDLVSVCTPNKFHKSLTIAALQHGAHVLCEKPMALNTAEAKEMLDEANRLGKRIMINFSYRFVPQSLALKKQIGLIGDIYFGRTFWHRRRDIPRFGGWFGIKELSGGGPMIDIGIHRLDLALWLMNYPKPVWVLGATFDPIASRRAKAEGKLFDVEDLAAATITFENGAMLTVEASWASHQKEAQAMETTLFGTEGGLRQRNLGGGYGGYEAEFCFDRDGIACDMKLLPDESQRTSSVAHFVDAILSGTPHIGTGEEGVRVMQILDAIYESARTKAPVKIE